MLTRNDPEIGVASTKAYTTQLAALFLFAVKLGRLRAALTEIGVEVAAGSAAHAHHIRGGSSGPRSRVS